MRSCMKRRRKHKRLWSYWQQMTSNVLSYKRAEGSEHFSLALVFQQLLNTPTTGGYIFLIHMLASAGMLTGLHSLLAA